MTFLHIATKPLLKSIQLMHHDRAEGSMRRTLTTFIAGVLLLTWGASVRDLSGRTSAAPQKIEMSLDDARSVIEALPKDLPKEFAGKSFPQLEKLWPEWRHRHDLEIRARLDRGDQDSIVNFWLYGTSFTKAARAIPRDFGGEGARLDTVLDQRARDLTAALRAVADDERIQFAKAVVRRQGIDVSASDGADKLRRFLLAARKDVIAEYNRYQAQLDDAARKDKNANITAYATIFRDRGLSSDTSLLPSFGIDQALEAARSQQLISRVTNVAIVGPGLDFTNKADGYDFYPLQTSQPYVVADSLVRLGLSAGDELTITALYISPRVVRHIESARDASQSAARPYDVQIPLTREEAWTPALLHFWNTVGERAGDVVGPMQPPPAAGALRLRAIRMNPGLVQRVNALDCNVVLERLAADEPLFDLVIATNVFVYYNVFEQALATANLAAMIRPGGLIVTNTLVLPTSPLSAAIAELSVPYSDKQGDHMFVYRKLRR